MSEPKSFLKFIVDPNNPPIYNHLQVRIESSDETCIRTAIDIAKAHAAFDSSDARTDTNYSVVGESKRYIFRFHTKLGTSLNDLLHELSFQVSAVLTNKKIQCWITYDQIVEPQGTDKY